MVMDVHFQERLSRVSILLSQKDELDHKNDQRQTYLCHVELENLLNAEICRTDSFGIDIEVVFAVEDVNYSARALEQTL